MSLQEDVEPIIGQQESLNIEYKAVLPPSKAIAQILCSFANTDGGILILGVSEVGGFRVTGLSEDFRATSITHKAIDLLMPKPLIDYGYIEKNGKKLFAIKVQKSDNIISVGGNIYIRQDTRTILSNPIEIAFKARGYQRIKSISIKLIGLIESSTDSKMRILDHYKSVLKIFDDSKELLYPENAQQKTFINEGKVLTRILFSSIVDNFETYLSDILFEIYLAKPETLKSEQMVKVEDVLNCSDLQEFISYWAKQKIGKLQKGSVKGFVKENKQIRDLNVIIESEQEEIERILQIRHLYSHRNGIVDEKFLKYFPTGYSIGTEHQMTIDDILDKIEYLSNMVDMIDNQAIVKYSLSSI